MQKGKIHAFIGIQPNLICKQKKGENKDLSQSAGGREREYKGLLHETTTL